MPKRPLSNLSNNFKTQSANTNQQTITKTNLKRSFDDESKNDSSKKSKNQNATDIDQENEKNSVLKKIICVNRIFENITNSNLRTSFQSTNLSKKKDDKPITILNNQKINDQPSFLGIKDKDYELIEIFNKNVKNRLSEEKTEIDEQIDERKATIIDFSDPINYYESPANLPDDVEDYDLKNIGDINAEAQYAFDIFEYYFEREKQFRIRDYIDYQPEISRTMRTILG